MRHGYGKFHNSEVYTNTATGSVRLQTCDINSIRIANSFTYESLTVNVLSGWGHRAIVGVVGMDIISRLTFVLYHKTRQFLLTDKDIPALRDVMQLQP